MALVIAYDMYKECVTEPLAMEAFGIRKEDKIKVLDFHEFRGNCSKGGMDYNPAKQKYPGDQHMRNVTRLTLKKRVMLRDSTDGSLSVRTVGRPKRTQQVVELLTTECLKQFKKLLQITLDFAVI